MNGDVSMPICAGAENPTGRHHGLQNSVLSGKLTTMCMYCNHVRNEDNERQAGDPNPRNRTTRFTHGVCPQCYDNVAEAWLADKL